jgi:hypothetical protein
MLRIMHQCTGPQEPQQSNTGNTVSSGSREQLTQSPTPSASDLYGYLVALCVAIDLRLNVAVLPVDEGADRQDC